MNRRSFLATLLAAGAATALPAPAWEALEQWAADAPLAPAPVSMVEIDALLKEYFCRPILDSLITDSALVSLFQETNDHRIHETDGRYIEFNL